MHEGGGKLNFGFLFDKSEARDKIWKFSQIYSIEDAHNLINEA